MSDETTRVRIWWAEPRLVEGWLPLLDPGERARFDNYRRPADRARFLTGTMILRHLYAADLGVSPAAVRLARHCPDCDRPHGKVSGPGRLEISVSHSGDRVIVASCADYPVGVDVEQADPAVDHRGVAALVATDEEQAALNAGQMSLARAFTRLWTRKEAVLKALGEGLRTPMRDFTVSGPDEAAAVVGWPARPGLPGRLRLADLEADPGYGAAVAVLDSPGPVCIQCCPASELSADFG
jgi:4'-phosphopantetheinyl transferase